MSLVEQISEFIANHDMRNHHYLRDEEIIRAFWWARKKDVKSAIRKLR